MKKWLILLGVALMCMTNAGCFVSVWDPNPAARAMQLLIMSEELRQTRNSIYAFSFLDDFSALSPQRTTGVVGP